MKEYGKEMVVTTALAATLVVTLVLTSNFIASYLEVPGSFVKVYATGATIQDAPQVTEDFENKTVSAGGGFQTIYYCPYVRLIFENGAERLYHEKYWSNEGTVDASELKEIHVYSSTLSSYGCHSEEFINFTKAGNFSWYGNYNKGSEIRSSLQVNDETTDLGTRFETNVLFTFNLNAYTIVPSNASRYMLRFPHDEYKYPPPELRPIRRESGVWTLGKWRMNSSQLLEMVDQSESASILFDGSVWLDGNYTVTVNGVPEYRTTNLSKDVSFGRIDLTFEDGKISTLSFKFSRIDIILFAHPEE